MRPKVALPGGDAVPGLLKPVTSASAVTKGCYYALAIGIDDYPVGIPKLKTAVRDATSVAGVLKGT